MYELNDTASAVKEVQKFLYVISDKAHPEVPRISVDGIYGTETQDAVKIFQEIYDIEPTGVVDRVTFELLYQVYDENRSIPQQQRMDEELFPIQLGNSGNHVLKIHLLMSDLKERYSGIGRIPKDSYFSVDSKNATKEFQKIFRFSETGAIEYELYLRMLAELTCIENITSDNFSNSVKTS